MARRARRQQLRASGGVLTTARAGMPLQLLSAKARAEGRAALRARAQARAADLMPTIKDLQAAGCESLRATAAGLEERGIPAPRGGSWSAVQVSRVLQHA